METTTQSTLPIKIATEEDVQTIHNITVEEDHLLEKSYEQIQKEITQGLLFVLKDEHGTIQGMSSATEYYFEGQKIYERGSVWMHNDLRGKKFKDKKPYFVHLVDRILEALAGNLYFCITEVGAIVQYCERANFNKIENSDTNRQQYKSFFATIESNEATQLKTDEHVYANDSLLSLLSS